MEVGIQGYNYAPILPGLFQDSGITGSAEPNICRMHGIEAQVD